jgi:biopolymer transport protein ExbB
LQIQSQGIKHAFDEVCRAAAGGTADRATRNDMTELISKGGPLVWLLMACMGLSLAITLERLAYFHRASMNVGEFLSGLAALIRKRNFAEALQECVATRVPAGRVIHAALLRHHAPRRRQ